MAVAKNPGIGQGRGGGRPKGKTRDVEEMRLRLSPHVAELLRTLATQSQIPAWQVVERAILAMDGGAFEPTPTVPPFPSEAREIALEAAAFLLTHENRHAALKVLRRAWKQALSLAHHDLLKT